MQFLAKQMKEQRDYTFNQKLNIFRPPIKEEVIHFCPVSPNYCNILTSSATAHEKGLAILCPHRV
jgi:hypothetical protein